MIQIVLHRSLSLVIACSDGMQWERGDTSHGWQDKSPDLRLGHVVGWLDVLDIGTRVPAGACIAKFNDFNASSAVGLFLRMSDAMSDR